MPVASRHSVKWLPVWRTNSTSRCRRSRCPPRCWGSRPTAAAPDTQTVLKSCRCIADQAQRAAQIIDNLREFSRPIAAHNAPVRLAGALAVVTEITSGSLGSAGEALQVTLPDDLPAVLGEPTRIEQVLLNLIGNARDALRTSHVSDRRINIDAAEAAGKVMVRVSDNAGGIPPDMLDRVFAPFFTTKGKANGTGLGLSIARTAMCAMDGSISVRNGSEGAVFTLTFEHAAAGDGGLPG